MRKPSSGINVHLFIVAFLLGIYNLKPVALFTNSLKKSMDTENVGNV